MIKIFRKIRRELLIKDIGAGRLKKLKIGRYLVYAFGEIILVVIGILIALQINNWNNNKLSQDKEMSILKEVSRNLKVNVENFSLEIEHQDSIIRNIDLIFGQLKNKVPFHDSLGRKYASIAWTEEFTVTNSAFETLKTIGFDLIKSDSLRENIIRLFNVEYLRMSDVVEKVSSAEHGQLNQFYLTHIEWDKQGNCIINDNQRLFQDIGFTNMLSSRRVWKIDIIDTYKQLIDESLELSNSIEREIRKRA